ncbi:MAG: hypothetical protein KDK51_09790, partial [Deltaproteobacteria bacterium]|nr:hypothetical protein [Deltaproteobacteria bacterium]
PFPKLKKVMGSLLVVFLLVDGVVIFKKLMTSKKYKPSGSHYAVVRSKLAFAQFEKWIGFHSHRPRYSASVMMDPLVIPFNFCQNYRISSRLIVDRLTYSPRCLHKQSPSFVYVESPKDEHVKDLNYILLTVPRIANFKEWESWREELQSEFELLSVFEGKEGLALFKRR